MVEWEELSYDQLVNELWELNNTYFWVDLWKELNQKRVVIQTFCSDTGTIELKTTFVQIYDRILYRYQ